MTVAYFSVALLVALLCAYRMPARTAAQWIAAACIGVAWPVAMVTMLVTMAEVE